MYLPKQQFSTQVHVRPLESATPSICTHKGPPPPDMTAWCSTGDKYSLPSEHSLTHAL